VSHRSFGFDDLFKADEVLLALRKLQQQHLIDLEDAARWRNADGTVHIASPPVTIGAAAAVGGACGDARASVPQSAGGSRYWCC
jgi:uncharacterized membrane protein